MMTRKLYQEDMYMKEFDAEVVSADGNVIVLDATAFAPAAGGQPCDRGTVDGAEVISVEEKDGVILHELSSAVKAGSRVHCVLDWDRRFDHMQNHLGEHILSAVFKSEYGLDNKGFHLGEDSATFDIDAKEISQEMLDHVELMANEIVYKGLPVEIVMIENAEEAAKLPLRKELKAEEDITVVTVPGVDCVACCCPHPSDTAQIGIIKLIKTEKYKGMTRVHYKCGRRALEDYRQKHSVMSMLCEKYSADEFTLPDKIKASDAKNEDVRREMNRLKDALADIHAAELMSGADVAVMGELEKASLDDLRQIAKKLVKQTDLPIVLSSASELCVFMTHSGKCGMKCGTLVKEFAVGAGGKGGGGDTQAQVFFNNADLMRNFTAIVKAGLK
jgi:alanyl-tRNA synthetase